MRAILAAKQHYSGADLPFPPPWTFRLCWSRKLSRKLRHRLLGAAILAALASCLSPRGAQAGDLEDCNSSVAEKIEAGCTAIINNPARTPEDALKAFANRGRLYNQRSKFDAALADAEAALQLNAQSVLALLVRGYAYQRKNNFDAALADFDQAIGIDPKNVGAYQSRGQQRNWTEAQKDFDQTLALRPDFAQGLR
jgi:tetratricopeptide (TPR) repeat protein